MTRTHAEVIEEHRVKVGATSVHVDYNPSCDPEELATSLERSRQHIALFHSIDPVTRLEAEVERLRGIVRTLGKLGTTHYKDLASQSDEVFALKHQIFEATELKLFEDPSYTIEFARNKGVL